MSIRFQKKTSRMLKTGKICQVQVKSLLKLMILFIIIRKLFNTGKRFWLVKFLRLLQVVEMESKICIIKWLMEKQHYQRKEKNLDKYHRISSRYLSKNLKVLRSKLKSKISKRKFFKTQYNNKFCKTRSEKVIKVAEKA